MIARIEGKAYELKPIDHFEAGRWYVYLGKTRPPQGWSSRGATDFVLDGKPHKCNTADIDDGNIRAKFFDDGRFWYWYGGLENWREVVGYNGPADAPSTIYVFGDYPAEKMPELLETARKIAECGSCSGISCRSCPSANDLHGSPCILRNPTGRMNGLNKAWFRAFVERYGDCASQGHWHSMPTAGMTHGAVMVGSPPPSPMQIFDDKVNGTPLVGISPIQTAYDDIKKLSMWNEIERQSLLLRQFIGLAYHPESATARRKRMLHADI